MEQSSTIPKRALISHRRLTLIANICWNIVYYLTNRYLNRNNACTSIFLRMWKTLFWKRGFGMRPNTDYFIYLFVCFHRIERIFHALQTVFSAKEDRQSNEHRFAIDLLRAYIYASSSARLIFAIHIVLAVAVSKDCFIRIHSTTKFITMTMYKWDTTQKWA